MSFDCVSNVRDKWTNEKGLVTKLRVYSMHTLAIKKLLYV